VTSERNRLTERLNSLGATAQLKHDLDKARAQVSILSISDEKFLEQIKSLISGQIFTQ
jgi:hypothetical protein